MNVFVYGTLRKGFGNHYLLETSEYLGEFRQPIHFDMVDMGAFPGLVETNNPFSSTITVEGYKVTEETLKRLDSLEGYPSFYNRKIIKIGDIEGYIYYLNGGNRYNYKIVREGDWLEYKYYSNRKERKREKKEKTLLRQWKNGKVQYDLEPF